MTYDEFKTYVISHLWKRGDTYVIDSLDTLITTAHTELERVLREVPERDNIVEEAATTTPWPLPADAHRVRGIKREGAKGGMQYVAPFEWFDFVDHPGDRNPNGYYTTSGNLILFKADGISVDKPVNLTLWYERKIPDFKGVGTSWVADTYFDLYLYCVLKHTAPFLREDERLATWGALYADALNTVIEDGADRRYAGSPLHLQWNGTIR
jgi:hypothetical protein